MCIAKNKFMSILEHNAQKICIQSGEVSMTCVFGVTKNDSGIHLVQFLNKKVVLNISA